MDLADRLPQELRNLADPQTDLPRIAKDRKLTALIESVVREIPSHHDLRRGDARDLRADSVHLVLTSPPYWTLKEYRKTDGQLGHIEDYEAFLGELDKVWQRCYEALVARRPASTAWWATFACPAGRTVVGTRSCRFTPPFKNTAGGSASTTLPRSSGTRSPTPSMRSRTVPVFWASLTNRNAVIKNDIEYILMQRKPGGYRTPSVATRVLSVIPEDSHREWFQQIWTGSARGVDKAPSGPLPNRTGRAADSHVQFRRRHRARPLHGHRHDEHRSELVGQEQHRRRS